MEQQGGLATRRSALLPLAAALVAALAVSSSAQPVPPSQAPAPPPTNAPDFRVTVSPEAITVRRGTTGQVTVQVEASGGFKGRVDLLSSLLYETKTTFEPTALETGSGTAALRIAPSAGAIKGTYVLSVSGVAGSFTHSAFVRLTIK